METSKHVIHDIKRVSKDLVESMKALPTATIHEAYGGKGAFSHYIKSINTGMKLCGPVIPVKACPGDNLIVDTNTIVHVPHYNHSPTDRPSTDHLLSALTDLLRGTTNE